MATAKNWEDIEEGFFLCSICLDQYKEPKLLPCVHRFCRKCLEKVIEKCKVTLECPLCKDQCNIPTTGVDGFKTDFHMKSLLEVIQLQKSLDKEEIRECVGCSKQRKATSYCFKCIGFLCEICYQFHLDSPMVKDHKPNVVTLKDIQQKGLSLEKLSSLREVPRCEVHPEKMSELCCVTCDNLPVCIACGSYGKHKGHYLQEITELASGERQKLVDNIAILDAHKSNVYSLPQKIEAFKKQLSTKINTKQEAIRMKHETETGKIEAKLQASRDKLATDLQENASQEETNLVKLNAEMEEEIKEIREKYKRLIETNNTEHEKKRQNLRTKQTLQDQRLTLDLKQLELCKTEFIGRVDDYSNKLNEQIKELVAESEKRISRFDNYLTSANSILASKNDWTDVRCLPDINSSFKALLDDLISDKFFNYRIFPDIKMPDSHVVISEQRNPNVYIDTFKDNNWKVTGVASAEGGKIVVTGGTEISAHITVTNVKGEIIHQYHIEPKAARRPRSSYCASFSPTEVVVVVQPSEIGIFNVRGYTYTSNDIKELSPEWKPIEKVRCVATNPVNHDIFVGTVTRKVLIFDKDRNYRSSFLLPDVITYPRTMSINMGNIFVCDVGNGKDQKAYCLKLHGGSCDVMCELEAPDVYKGNWKSLDVFIEDDQFIYVEWEIAQELNLHKGFVTQYSQDGFVKLTTRGMKARRITSVKTDEGLVLLGTSCQNGKMVSYKLTKMLSC